MTTTTKELTGWHIAGMFCTGFAIIIGVNITLAVNAVRTFPGLEVKNSYVASQQFDENRTKQHALNWDVTAQIVKDKLNLMIMSDGIPVQPEIVSALFGRATHTGEDQNLMFKFDGRKFVAPVRAGSGNWNLRLLALAQNGTKFQQRVVIRVAP